MEIVHEYIFSLVQTLRFSYRKFDFKVSVLCCSEAGHISQNETRVSNIFHMSINFLIYYSN